jgi:hypothetical protein
MLKYEVHGLPGGPCGTFTLIVSDRFVWVPGHGGGRDGPTVPDQHGARSTRCPINTVPDHPEQESWMRAHGGLHESW